MHMSTAAKITNKQWMQEQAQEPIISQVVRLCKEKRIGKYKTNAADSKDLRTMMHHKQQYLIRNGLLYKKVQTTQREGPSLQFVLPAKYRKQALHACHEDVGHLGIEHCTDLLKEDSTGPTWFRT